MKANHLSLVRAISVAAIALLGMQAANAATLGVQIYQPDLTSNGATVTYDFTALCTSSNGGAGVLACGTRDKGKDYDIISEADSSGLLTISMSGNQIINNPEGGFSFVSSGGYTLTANFDGAGSFVDGNLLGTGTSTDPRYSGPTIVSGDLTDFGFGGTGSAGTFDFFFDNVGGDFAAFYTNYAGVIANITGLNEATGDWETGLDFQASFSAGANVNTTVPVPAAVWLFGSGLIGLAGLGRRNRRKIER